MIKILTTLAACYILLLLLLYVFQRSLLYQPTDISPLALTPENPFKQFAIESHDGFELKHWRFQGRENKKTIVFFHGNAGNAADRIMMMRRPAQEGFNIILAEYRGYGDNPGKPSEQANIADAENLINHLISQGLNEKDIILMGRSLGTGVAVQMATKYDASLLALISPYSSMADVAASHYPILPVKLLLKDRYNNIEHIKNVDVPILMFHGNRDKVIPIKFGQKLANINNNAQFNELLGYGHNDLNMDDINNHILEYLNNSLD
ncbi:alpha/beta hydrolase [Pseudemcibacter aquimaris]|uniref:alpha/beta hydrolase n=1 Tax=Pseudemcibacter aquimaris TaxID=2857064 RepID=UPI00201112D1|nr:alpha/beta hydrolase [Pseudemcibacter aquimaris]MCC3861214.1 alpha/beta hydrolase [Pseudemcibacter aquimaris]WDU57989.1 alpha/beta hydrolase [Pseudemcibacter aquimaris]